MISDHLTGAIRRLRGSLEAATRRSRLLGQPVLAWTRHTIPSPFDPLDLVARTAAKERMLWSRPDRQFCLAGAGAAWAFSASGENRFAQAEAAWRSVLEQALGEATANARNDGERPVDVAPGPIAFYGFAFAPGPEPSGPSTPGGPALGGSASRGWIRQAWTGYPDALIIIPRVMVGRIADQSWLILAAMADGSGRFPAETYEQALACLMSTYGALACLPDELTDHRAEAIDVGDPSAPNGLAVVDEFPPAETWKESVRVTAAAVRAGSLRKAVLARGIHVRAHRLDPVAALRALREDYPACTLFAFAREGRWFLGATPERLVRVRNGEAAVAAVAGTAPRGRTEEEDRRLGAMLLASPKDRIEHAIVVEALREALAPVCTTVDAEDVPRLLTVRNAHHLHTPVRCGLRDRQTVLALTGRLHPTPAVGGTPPRDALGWIHRHEGWNRGWYAGPIGWVDCTGGGESAVAIRCALVRDHEALLFAGCGIVADSDPGQEYEESDLKLRPVVSALASTAEREDAPPAPRRKDA